ncbi:hypothetical protein BG004_002834 [Podila humilis]|nr:hypothetical protein BG004_002834 [Podila humilis]
MLDMSIEWFCRTHEPYLGLSADCLAQIFVKDDDAAASLSNANDPEDPLSKTKGTYIMADGYVSLANEYLFPSVTGGYHEGLIRRIRYGQLVEALLQIRKSTVLRQFETVPLLYTRHTIDGNT